VRESLQRPLRDGTLVTIAFAIALGLSLYSVAQGANVLVTNLLKENPRLDSTGDIGNLVSQYNAGALTWRVGNRVLTFGALVGGLVELAVVLAAATFVYRWRDRDANPPSTSDDIGDDGGENLAGSGV
jgi:hypothetical protein